MCFESSSDSHPEHPAFTLGGLSLVGGIMGYAKKKSLPSLVAGTSISALYFFAGYLLKENKEYGIHTALATSAVLAGAGISRSSKTGFKKPVPLMLALLGLTSTGYYAYKYNQFY
ncbi:hypothetical protein CANARDRAFT_9059 [[Candida] arabinofermentans NRRL YB-2248]|uniref:Transmembrane protein 14 n=1 Tax=[Candida] arabinofermentans NRRL YB-2248 TaxID=983967 RepID=A0A1E4SX51_9ASCO|nr:hypothetical protein CANARDRAFT_9059 [[Candida] arabinofermentans NRRL YB-2248]